MTIIKKLHFLDAKKKKKKKKKKQKAQITEGSHILIRVVKRELVNG